MYYNIFYYYDIYQKMKNITIHDNIIEKKIIEYITELDTLSVKISHMYGFIEKSIEFSTIRNLIIKINITTGLSIKQIDDLFEDLYQYEYDNSIKILYSLYLRKSV